MTPAERLAQSRRAIIEYLQRREHRHEGRPPNGEPEPEPEISDPHIPWRERGWLGAITDAARTWWRYHPAHLALDVATPALQLYARKKPLQVLGIAAGVGAALVLARPWRLISLTTLLIAAVKSSQLSTVVLSALSGAEGWQAGQHKD
jgi:hypothetical protein